MVTNGEPGSLNTGGRPPGVTAQEAAAQTNSHPSRTPRGLGGPHAEDPPPLLAGGPERRDHFTPEGAGDWFGLASGLALLMMGTEHGELPRR